MEDKKHDVSRRDFMKTAVATSAALGGLTILGAGSAPGQEKRVFKVGLIGCGGRGNGAVRNCISAGKVIGVDVRVTALADVFQDRLNRTIGGLKKEGTEVPKENCFLGFDAYKKLMATDVEVVLLATPPNFRPRHFPAAVEAGKHVFMEKPVAVDPVGCRRIMATGEAAKKKDLSVVAGTQRRHEKNYLALYGAIKDGAIGQIRGGTAHFCLSGGWGASRRPGWSDTEYLIRQWGGFAEMSGDHIVEQHVHSLDVVNWFLETHPINAVSFGGRARRRGGNMYDFFSTDYEYPNGVHIHSMCRQVKGCWNRYGQYFIGDRGIVDLYGLVRADRVFLGSHDRKKNFPIPKAEGHQNPYVQEHADLLKSILKGQPINEAQNVAESTLTAVMGRISAYTGQMITWDEMMKSDFACKPTPEDFETGNVKAPPEVVPVPGKA